MNLIPFAIRQSAVGALRAANTISANRIFDSAFLPIDEILSKDPAPLIVVSTESETVTPTGRDVHTGNRQVELVIEFAISTPTPAQTDDGEVLIPPTDPALEFSLAILGRQISAALWGAGGGAYGHAFRKLCSQVAQITVQRGVRVQDGVRYAARMAVITVNAVAEPPYATAVDPAAPFGVFLAAFEADPANAEIAAVLRHTLTGQPVSWPDVYSAAGVLGGYTDDEARKIGIAPAGGYADPDDEDETDTLAEVVVEPDGWVGNEETVGEQLPEEPGA